MILSKLFLVSVTKKLDQLSQQCFLKQRVPARGDAVRVPEVETVGESGADLMVFAYHKAVFIPFRIRKADVLGAAKQIHADIRADALQYRVGFFLYLKEEQDTLPTGEQEKQDAQGKKGHIPISANLMKTIQKVNILEDS